MSFQFWQIRFQTGHSEQLFQYKRMHEISYSQRDTMLPSHFHQNQILYAQETDFTFAGVGYNVYDYPVATRIFVLSVGGLVVWRYMIRFLNKRIVIMRQWMVIDFMFGHNQWIPLQFYLLRRRSFIDVELYCRYFDGTINAANIRKNGNLSWTFLLLLLLNRNNM